MGSDWVGWDGMGWVCIVLVMRDTDRWRAVRKLYAVDIRRGTSHA